MPHGPLTPLGHRLRSVLASLRPNACHYLDNASINPPKSLRRRASHTANALTTTRRPRPNASYAGPSTPTYSRAHHAAAASAFGIGEATEEDTAPRAPMRAISRRRENRRTKVDYLGEELRAVGRSDVAPRLPPERRRGNHFSHRSRHRKRLHADNAKRHALDDIPALEGARTLTINRILASYIRHIGDYNIKTNLPRAEFHLSSSDRRFLATMNYDMRDVKLWAAVITESDSVKSAETISARITSHGTGSVPLPVISYILRRPYLTAEALRILVKHIWDILEYLDRSSAAHLSPDAVFVVFNRLVRHARGVWPAALPFIADQLVRFLPEVKQDRMGDIGSSAQTITFMLNKAMSLLTEPSAVAPFKDIHYQEQAVIRILSAMAEHDPPLQIEREGYRAVIRMQLAMGKTDNEREWAALKALSWPPWKEDRTSMDSEIGPEHGISRARATLHRMREAGYAFQLWEQIAGVYTGWDIDGTPTIQTRVIMPIWSTENQKEEDRTQEIDFDQYHKAALWTARIKTTRTVQEAWACYLAYKDAEIPTDQSVIIAILEKLHREEMRQRKLARTNDSAPLADSLTKLYPGDTRDVEPLPPSTHLYTYTRTNPPSVQDFYTQLQGGDTDLYARCLAYLISNAASFKDGMSYLRAAASRYPALAGLLSPDLEVDIDGVPATLFHAYVEFLSRFSNAETTIIFAEHRAPSLDIPSVQLADTHFNFQHNLIQAIWLLKERRAGFLPTWNAVLKALARTESYKTIHLTESGANLTNAKGLPDPDYNTIIAYRLAQKVLRVLQEQKMVPDTYGFIAFCQSTENVAIACWNIIHRDYQPQKAEDDASTATNEFAVRLATEANELLARQRPYGRIEQYFKLLVGEDSFSRLGDTTTLPLPDDPTSLTPACSPRLLAIPEPPVLHAYIRALGWHGSHTRIIRVLKWMVKHNAELTSAADQARNGAISIRRTIIAVRVFLERSWRVTEVEVDADTDADASFIQDYGFADEDAFTAVGLGKEEDAKPAVLRRLEATAFEEQIEEAKALVDNAYMNTINSNNITTSSHHPILHHIDTTISFKYTLESQPTKRTHILNIN